MKSYLIKRIVSMAFTLWMISMVMFLLVKLMPQDPVALAMPSHVKVAQRQIVYDQLKEEMGLNDSLVVQYGKWLGRTLRGDFGTSLTYKKPVKDVIKQPLINTLRLNIMVFLLSFLIALVGGVYSALHKGKKIDRIWQSITLFGMSVPGYFLALIIIYVFAFRFHLFPSSGTWISSQSLIENLRVMVLPVATLTLLSFCTMERYIRDHMILVLEQEYMSACMARGVHGVRLMLHGLRGALLPFITLWMNELSMLLVGSVFIEYIFAYDGIGRILLEALNRRDYMLVIALNFLYALIYLLMNFIDDLLYGIADPRVKHS